jgi:hypothetical protein
VYVHKKRLQKNPPVELMITVMLHKTDDTEWTVEELSPIKEISMMDITPSGSPVGARLVLHDGDEYLLDFKDIDGARTC